MVSLIFEFLYVTRRRERERERERKREKRHQIMKYTQYISLPTTPKNQKSYETKLDIPVLIYLTLVPHPCNNKDGSCSPEARALRSSI